MRIRIFLVLFLIFFLVQPHAYAEGSNRISNAGFEETLNGEASRWAIWMWKQNSEVCTDSTNFHSGKYSLRIVNNEENYAFYKQTVQVEENSYYKLGCWIKTENVGLQNKGANISIENLTETSVDIKGSSKSWQYVELYGITGKDQNTLTITLGLGGYGSTNKGKAWFDDVVVERVTVLPPGKSAANLFTANMGVTGSGGKGYFVIVFLGIIFALAVLILITAVYKYRKPSSDSTGEAKKMIPVSSEPGPLVLKFRLDRKDAFIMGAMTLIYLIAALINLGSFKSPKTSWTPTTAGEYFTVSLGKEVELSRMTFYCGMGNNKDASGKLMIGGRYQIEYRDSKGDFVPLTNFEKRDAYDVFLWKVVENFPKVKTKEIKFNVDAPGGTIHEIGVFESGSKSPIKNVKVVDKKESKSDQGKIEYLFDEQDKVQYKYTYMNSTYFDEIYHPRTAYEFLNGIRPYEDSHPPLGKLFISIGISIFGMNPFGWRIIGTLVGAAMIPAMYAFGKKLYDKRLLAFCSGFLIMFDFMHFVQTRIATIDSYSTFFIILMYYYMYDYFINKSYQVGFIKSLKPLLLCGIFFGIGAASKWIVLYAAGGLAAIFFISKVTEFLEYYKLNLDRRKIKHSKKPVWMRDYMRIYLVGTIASCIIFFIIIPAIIYYISYIPFINTSGNGLKDVIDNQTYMFGYHDDLEAEHVFSSKPVTWPAMVKPMGYYVDPEAAEGKASAISAMGNPAIWWVGMIGVPLALILSILKKDKKMLVIYIAIFFQYVPWFFISRVLFIYHYFSVVPFMILSIVYLIKNLMDVTSYSRYCVYAYLVIVAILFIMFYPILSGMEVSRGYIEENLRWFPDSWIF